MGQGEIIGNAAKTAIGGQRKAKPTPDDHGGFWRTSYDPPLDILSAFEFFYSASILLFQFITNITTFKISQLRQLPAGR
jgi:hypothetical protein